VWEELEWRGVEIAVGRFSRRAGRAGEVAEVVFGQVDGDELAEAERQSVYDGLAHALAGPIWDRFATFTGQPRSAGHSPRRRLTGGMSAGQRGGQRFEAVPPW
jgi:hypothetical protein